MKTMIAAVLLAATSLTCTVPAMAQAPVNVPTLAPGEVLVEVNSVGIVRSPATSATLRGSLSAEGANEAEARRQLDTRIQQLTAAARSGGAAASDIDIDDRSVTEVEDFDELLSASMSMTEESPAEAAAAEPAARRWAGSARFTIRMRDGTRAIALKERINDLEGATSQVPELELGDDTAARRTARSQAVTSARADAETYAAALNMRVVRIARVTERLGVDVAGMFLNESNLVMRTARNLERADGQVETYALVGVDFVLAPR